MTSLPPITTKPIFRFSYYIYSNTQTIIRGNVINLRGYEVATRKEGTFMELTELGLSAEQLEVVNKAIQSETDKVRTDYSGKLKGVNDELAKYKPADKTDAEKLLEQKEKELVDKEKAIADKEKTITVKEKLTEKGLPVELAKYINIGDDVDTALDEFGSTLSSMLLNGSYKPSNHKNNDGMTKEDFKKMGYVERNKLFETNPELYKKLSN